MLVEGHESDLFEKLQSAELFSCVGTHLGGDYEHLQSWEAACAMRSSDASQEFHNEARNNISRSILENSSIKNIYSPHSEKFDSMIHPIVEKNLSKRLIPNDLLGVVRNALGWDLYFLLVELKYLNVTSVRTYHTIATIYLRGHFFCGWDGEVPYDDRDYPLPWGGDFPPNGRLAIY
jgi:hypothetical protein